MGTASGWPKARRVLCSPAGLTPPTIMIMPVSAGAAARGRAAASVVASPHLAGATVTPAITRCTVSGGSGLQHCAGRVRATSHQRQRLHARRQSVACCTVINDRWRAGRRMMARELHAPRHSPTSWSIARCCQPAAPRDPRFVPTPPPTLQSACLLPTAPGARAARTCNAAPRLAIAIAASWRRGPDTPVTLRWCNATPRSLVLSATVSVSAVTAAAAWVPMTAATATATAPTTAAQAPAAISVT